MPRRLAALTVVLALAAPGGAQAADGPALSVDAGADLHPISPLVYGMNLADQGLADELALPVDRWGGNVFESYSFRLGAVNTGNDYFFEDIADCFAFDTGCAGGNVPFYRAFVSRALARGTQPLMQLPLSGYVAKTAPTAHPFVCGFPQAGQQRYDPYDAGCGNGRTAAGAAVASDPTNDGAAITPGDQAGWVGDLSARGVHLYELGNEPALWSSTHRDTHPSATTYDELWTKSRALAEAVKGGDPSSQVIGFSEWGWPNYFCSAADVDHADGYCGDGKNGDRAAHADKPLVNWLLGRFRDQSAADGRRLLDYVDVHYYPAGRDPAHPMDAARSLWDPTYVDPSYVGTPIRLIRRMREWVAADFPGTKTALTEYDLSDPSLSPQQNTVLEADALGVFGREGLDLATYFDEGYADKDSTASGTRQAAPLANAFRMFRDYDGRRGTFGETSVRASSADQSTLAVYAARRSDGALTVMVLNKTADPRTAPLGVAGAPAGAAVQTYRWAGGAQNSIQRLADGPLPSAATYPATSITLYVLPAPAATDPGPGGPDVALPGAPVKPVTPVVRHCRVPKVVGLSPARATARLRAACHVKVKVKRVRARGRRRGKVVRVSVAAGRRRDTGGTITLTVGRR